MRTMKRTVGLLFLWGFVLSTQSAVGAEPDAACADDARASIRLMHAAYPGTAAKFLGERATAIAEAEQSLLTAVKPPLLAAQCDAALLAYLSAWRDGHVGLVGEDGQKRAGNSQVVAPIDLAPFRFDLKPGVVVLRLPSFSLTAKPIAKLVSDLRQAAPIDTLMMDLRGNGGGTDIAFGELEAALRERAYQVLGVEARVTPETIEALELLRRLYTEAASKAEPGLVSQDLANIDSAIRRMRNHEGDWVNMAADSHFPAPSPNSPRLAKQVAVLVDERCASSCEQFLLNLRLGTDAIFIGTHSAGVLDYSNVVPFVLPSRTRVLMLPTTRSRRLPQAPIDGVGIPPDIPLDWGTCSDLCQWVHALRALREYRPQQLDTAP